MQTVYGLTDIGRHRAGNEDSFLIAPDRNLYIVADGMGGHQAGEVASRVAVQAMDAQLTIERLARVSGKPDAIQEMLAQIMRDTNKAILDIASQEPAYMGMGCTLVVAFIDSGLLHICNVGDARAYVSSPEGITQLSTDHSTAMILVEAGHMTREEIRSSPLRAEVTQAIGAPIPIVPAYRHYLLQKGDRVLLCSDGLWDMLPDDEIQRLLREDKPASALCGSLIDRANLAGGEDNITVVVLTDPTAPPH
jgi:protein phosphatase